MQLWLGPGFLLALLAIPVAAQQYTHLAGLIRDPSGAAVPSAVITITGEETGFRRTTRSSQDGVYVVSSLQPGSYKVTVRKEGFITLVEFGVKLDVAQPARADFNLSLGSMLETITVESGSAPLQTEDASIGTLIARDQLENLPLNGRGLLSLLELAPGTIVTPATRGESGQFTIGGQRPNTNYFTVDGVSVNTGVIGGGLPAQVSGGSLPAMTALGSLHGLVPIEALEEFRIQTATTSSEYGRLPGAQVSLSTRAGTNDFHGSWFHYLRHEALDANDWFSNSRGDGRLPLRMSDFGGSLGGPLRRNRTFFFASYEGLRLRQPFVWRAPSPIAAVRDNETPWVRVALSVFPLPNGPSLGPGLAEWTGRSSRPARFDAGNLRLDHLLTQRVTMFARYSEVPSSNEFSNTQVGYLDLRARTFTLGGNVRFRPAVVLDVRANLSQSAASTSWRSPDPLPDCYLEPATAAASGSPRQCHDLVRIGIGGIGEAVFGSEGIRKQNQWHVLPTISWALGSHQLRAGADYRRLSPLRRDASDSIGLIADTLNDLVKANPPWTAYAKASEIHADLSEVSAFLQDTWRASDRLTATLGLRWDFAAAPDPVLETVSPSSQQIGPFPIGPYGLPGQTGVWGNRYANLAPRGALAFRPSREGHTVIRAGYGFYFDSSLAIATDLINGGPFSLGQFRSGQNVVPTRLYYGFEPRLRLPEIRQWSLAVEHEILSRQLLSLTYTGSEGRDLLRRELRAPESTDQVELALATNHGASQYHALQLQYRGKITSRFQAIASYSWGHSIDDSSSDSALHWITPAINAGTDRGSSDFDVRHSGSAAVTWQIPGRGRLLKDWALDGIVRARTGFPIGVRSSEQYMGIGFANVFRPDLVPGQPLWLADGNAPGDRRLNPAAFSQPATGVQGNSGRNSIPGFGMNQLDLALRRQMRFAERLSLDLRAEALNLLNHPEFADPVRFLSSSLFGQSPSMLNLMLGTGSPASGLAPVFQTGGSRSLQVVLRLRF